MLIPHANSSKGAGFASRSPSGPTSATNQPDGSTLARDPRGSRHDVTTEVECLQPKQTNSGPMAHARWPMRSGCRCASANSPCGQDLPQALGQAHQASVMNVDIGEKRVCAEIGCGRCVAWPVPILLRELSGSTCRSRCSRRRIALRVARGGAAARGGRLAFVRYCPPMVGRSLAPAMRPRRRRGHVPQCLASEPSVVTR
jgi:hypothetical protein